MERFERTVYVAFAQRRKTLRNSLGRRLAPGGDKSAGKKRAAAALQAAAIPERSRAEELSLADFLRLHAAWKTLAE